MICARTGVLFALAVAGCYSPTAAVGLPCSPQLSCPSGQTCDVNAAGGPTCVIHLTDAGQADASPDASTDAPPDAVTLVGPDNDHPDGAIDIGNGGDFSFDLTNADDDDNSPGCGNTHGAPDVYFTVHLQHSEVIYFDTFGSIGDPIVTVRSGACGSGGNVESCADDSCNGTMAQGAANLSAGDHCFIVDQAQAVTGTAQIHFVRGKHSGDALPDASGTVSGDTCNDQNHNDAQCGCEPAMDHRYFFTVCPDTTVNAHISTCTLADWDTVLELRNAADDSLACADDTCGGQTEIAADAAGPGLFWAIVDGCNACGAYQLAYELN